MNTNPSLTWERLNNVFYRLRTCYNLSWDVDLSKYYVSIAPYCTAIAMTERSRLTSSANGTNGNAISAISFNSTFSIDICSGSGDPIYNIQWDEAKAGKIVGFGWNEAEDLIVVSDSAIVRRYYDFENNFSEFSLGISEDLKVNEVQFHDHGLVAKLGNGVFVAVENYNDPFPQFFSETYDGAGVFGIVSKYSGAEVLQATEKSLLRITPVGAFETGLDSGPYKFIAVSPNGSLVAIYSESSHSVLIVPGTFQHIISEFKLEEEDLVDEVSWCGNDAVACVVNSDELRVFGPATDNLSFYFNSPVKIFNQFDGLRVLSTEKLEFFSRVPHNTVDIFKIGSTTPSSILLDSLELKNSGDPTDNITALENVSIIKSSLKDTINECIQVATEEFDQYWQKKLLKAATFAKSHVELYNPEYLIEVIQNLKILNQIRSYKIGMFLTYSQFEKIDLNVLVNKLLLKRKYHLLSIKISEYLKLPVDLVYIDWCCSKIKLSNELDDNSLLAQILAKLDKTKNISLEKVSRVAYQEGRSSLAVMLIGYEPSSSRKIPLLLEMEEDELAVYKAEESFNFQVLQYVILYLQNKLAFSEFLKVMNGKKLALSYWEQLMKETQNWDILKSYYLSFDRKLTLANLHLILGLLGKTDVSLSEGMQAISAMKVSGISKPVNETTQITSSHDLQDLLNRFANQARSISTCIKSYEELKVTNKNIQDDLKYLKQELKLIETQESLQKTFSNLNFFGKSIVETLSLLILINTYDGSSSDTISSSSINKRINKILKDFSISEKRYYYLVIEKLSEVKKWTELYSFANSRKSPIGYEPFYKSCVKHNAIRQAGLYIDLITGAPYAVKLNMYLRVGNFKTAAEEAYKNKDLPGLKRVLAIYKEGSHPNAAVIQIIESFIKKL